MTTLGITMLRPVLYSSKYSHAVRVNYSKKAVPAIASLGKSKKKLGKLGPIIEKKELPVESDPEKLVNFVCGSNILKEGQDIQIKANSEYPSWLWDLRTGKPPSLERLNPEEKYYWRRIRKMAIWQSNKLAKLKKF